MARQSMVRKKVAKHRIKILDYGIEMQKTRIRWLQEYRELWKEETRDEKEA